MGVVIGIICCSEPTMMYVSPGVSALPKMQQWQTSAPLNLTLLSQTVRFFWVTVP